MRSAPTLAAALAGLLFLAGCTGPSDAEPSAQRTAAAAQPATAAPDAQRTLVVDADPVASAISTSRALFASSPVVVVAGSKDSAGQLLGASTAVGLGVPLLLGEAGRGTADLLGRELDRLGAATVLTVGDGAADVLPSGDKERQVLDVPADPAAVEAATGLTFAAADPVPADGVVAAVAGLDPDHPAALEPTAPPEPTPASGTANGTPSGTAGATSSGTANGTPSGTAGATSSGTANGTPSGTAGATSSSTRSGTAARHGSTGGRLPKVRRPAPLAAVLVLVSGSAESFAGVATARAAGADVELTGGGTDPRASADVVNALAADPAPKVIALGADFAAEPGLDWKLATAATGTQLPGGGQLLFPGRMLVALYGIPGSGALGVLGEQDLPASIKRAQDTAAPYRDLVHATVVPTFEIIATVASGSAGRDGNYSAEGDVETLRPWVEAAGAAGMYVVLDLQPGRTDFLTQAKEYQSLLELPYVGLALDPEWRLQPGELPLNQIGQVGINEINDVVTWLADLTREHALPQKLLLLHQFQVRMIIDRERLDTSRDELAIMVHADGQGGQPAKQSTWQVLHKNAPSPLYWGWKNFVDEDHPMLTPQQTIEQVLPTPELVTYQ